MNKIIGIITLMITVIAGMLCLGPPGQTIDDQATIALLITISDATDIVADYAVIMTATPATRSTTQNDFAISAELINCGAGEFALINRFAAEEYPGAPEYNISGSNGGLSDAFDSSIVRSAGAMSYPAKIAAPAERQLLLS